jgi:hypothetical protein
MYYSAFCCFDRNNIFMSLSFLLASCGNSSVIDLWTEDPQNSGQSCMCVCVCVCVVMIMYVSEL